MTAAVRARPRGAISETYRRIYEVVRRIPRGRVASYGQVAALAGLPHAPRVAGYALFALPPGSPLPWHRVVGFDGRLSLARLDPAAAITQRLRLERERVAFDRRGRVVIATFGIRPRVLVDRAGTRRRRAEIDPEGRFASMTEGPISARLRRARRLRARRPRAQRRVVESGASRR